MLFASLCLGSGAASLSTKVIKSIVPRNGRYISAIIFFIIIYSSFILDYVPINLLSYFSKYGNAGFNDAALRTIAKIKVFFGLTMYHLVLSMLLVDAKRKNDIGAKLQEGLWGAKIIALIAITVASLYFVPIKMLSWFVKISWGLSFIYLLIQNVLTIDMVYTNAYMIGQKIISSWSSGIYVVGFIIILAYSVAVSFAGIDLYRFNSASNIVITCWSMLVFHAITSVLSTLPYIQSRNDQAGLYQSSLIAAYTMCMLSDAFTTYNVGSRLFTSAGYLTLILSYAAFSMGSSSDKLVDLENGSSKDAMGDGDEVTYNMSFFNLMFALASTYAMLVFTNWSFIYQATSESAVGVIQNDKLGFYSKYFSAISLSLMYLWSLIAPVLFPQREFLA